MTGRDRTGRAWLGLLLCGMTAAACSSDTDEPSSEEPDVSKQALEQRAYIVSKLSDELTIIDLKKLEIIGSISTKGVDNHMAELTQDFREAFVDSPETNESIVVDVIKQKVIKRIKLQGAPTHISLSRDGKLFGVVEEDGNSVAFIDPAKKEVTKRVPGFMTPHFVRWAPDGEFAYVANIGAHYLTKIDVKKLEIVGTIPLDGIEPKPTTAQAPDETGFADAQIDSDGILHAADIGMGRVIVYDTNSREKLPEIKVGPKPWIVYAEHPFNNVPVRMVPNWGDKTVSSIHAKSHELKNIDDAGDVDSNGVNYSPLVPDKAFVMNRIRQDITVVDTDTGEITDRIDVGGTTETASTTADGKWIVATVSSANKVVVIDAVSNEIIKTFENVGKYPWSVTIPNGQNYCH